MDRSAYNNFTDFPKYPYKMFEHLISNNELIWKLLYYNSPDAWNQENLTKTQKGELIWAGKGKTNDFRCFLDDGQPDAQTGENALLHIMPYGISPTNRTVGVTQILIEAYSHYKINTLSSYESRVDVIMQQVLETFNGIVIPTVGSIGRLSFDKMGSGAARLEVAGQLPFRGKWLLMSAKSAKSE